MGVWARVRRRDQTWVVAQEPGASAIKTGLPHGSPWRLLRAGLPLQLTACGQAKYGGSHVRHAGRRRVVRACRLVQGPAPGCARVRRLVGHRHRAAAPETAYRPARGATGRCLDNTASGTALGNTIQLWACASVTNYAQLWY
jgi:hypothetical protein